MSDTIVHEHKRRTDAGEWPASFLDHPVTRSSNGEALFFYIYLDGVPYSINDSALGFWANWAITGARHLICALRKSRVCRCGCRGWCTYYTVFAYIHHCIQHLAMGIHSVSRFDGQPWQQSDELRSSWAGHDLECQGACAGIKQDLIEAAHTCAFSRWDTALPCFKCDATATNVFERVPAYHFPYGLVDYDSYDEACSRCELTVVARKNDCEYLDKRLRFIYKDSGSGYVLMENLPQYGLRTGDRLEPSKVLPDIGALSSLVVPHGSSVILTFWRRSNETRTRHRLPLMDMELRIVPERFLIDSLHTWNLGVIKDFSMDAVWETIIANAYRFEVTTQKDSHVRWKLELTLATRLCTRSAHAYQLHGMIYLCF